MEPWSVLIPFCKVREGDIWFTVYRDLQGFCWAQDPDEPPGVLCPAYPWMA